MLQVCRITDGKAGERGTDHWYFPHFYASSLYSKNTINVGASSMNGKAGKVLLRTRKKPLRLILLYVERCSEPCRILRFEVWRAGIDTYSR